MHQLAEKPWLLAYMNVKLRRRQFINFSKIKENKNLTYQQVQYIPALFEKCSFTHFLCTFFCLDSMLFGNLYIYFDWNGRTEIPGKVKLV